MLPLRDRNPSGIVPWVTYGLVAANVLAFLFEWSLSAEELNSFALRFGLVPARVTAAGAQYIISPGSPVPMIGASGAIGGVLGAYIVCWPRARVLTLVPFFYFIHLLELPALLVLGLWFVFQFLGGAASLGAAPGGGVAHWAHIGGFLAGVVLIKLLPARRGGRPARPAAWRRRPGPRDRRY